MGHKYTDEELHDASKRVMKSLNWMNAKPNRTLAKPAIKNSLGMAEGKISKSSRKRHNRKRNAELAGKPMDNLLDALPAVAEPPKPVPQSFAERKEAEVSDAHKKSKHSRKAEQKVVNHEIAHFGTKSLDDIRANILKMSGK